MLGLKLNHVSKRGHRWHHGLQPNKFWSRFHGDTIFFMLLHRNSAWNSRHNGNNIPYHRCLRRQSSPRLYPIEMDARVPPFCRRHFPIPFREREFGCIAPSTDEVDFVGFNGRWLVQQMTWHRTGHRPVVIKSLTPQGIIRPQWVIGDV